LGEFEEADRTYIFQFDSECVYMNNTHEWCAPGIEPQIENLQGVPIEVFPWWMNQMEQGEAVHIPLVSQLPPDAQELREALEPQNIQSLLSVPLIINNKLFGFVGLDVVKAPRTWDADTILLIKMMGDIFSNALMRKQTEIAVQQIEQRNRALIENAPDGIVLLDEKGQIIFGSPSAARIFGYENKDIVGALGREMVHPEDLPVVLEIQRIFANRLPSFSSAPIVFVIKMVPIGGSMLCTRTCWNSPASMLWWLTFGISLTRKLPLKRCFKVRAVSPRSLITARSGSPSLVLAITDW